MNWKFWKKDSSPEFHIETQEVSIPALARWYLYDTEVARPNDIATRLGMVPASPEGETAEVEASNHRQNQVLPYSAFINAMSSINANAMVAINSAMLDAPEDLNPEELEKVEQIMKSLYETISFLAIYSSFAAALELGIITNPGVVESNPTDGSEH